MKLHARLQSAQQMTNNPPIVLIHGLFGTLDNLGVLARDLVKDHDVLQIDLRNHGLSARSDTMTWPAMAQDVLDTLDEQHIDRAIFIGHSMGGKTAMAVTQQAPNRVEKLVAIDIAPVDYQVRRHDTIFAAIDAVNAAGVTTRQDAATVMRNIIDEEGVIQFLLKSFVNGEWRFNVPVLKAQYSNIVGWETVAPWPHPALFISGGQSPYIQEQYRETLLAQFPCAKAWVVAGAGHWVHAEKPDAVIRAIRRFLNPADQN